MWTQTSRTTWEVARHINPKPLNEEWHTRAGPKQHVLQRPCRKKALTTDVHRGSSGRFTRDALGFTPNLTNSVTKDASYFDVWVDITRKGNVGRRKPKDIGSKAENTRGKGYDLISLPWESRVRDCLFVFKLAAPIAQSRILAGWFPRYLFCSSLHVYEVALWSF